MRNVPWVTRYARSLSDSELDRCIEVRAVPIELGRDTLDVDAEALRAALERVFLSGIQVRKIIRQILDLARSHANHHFPSQDAYLTGLYQSFPWGSTPRPATCLSGLAGIGKSQLLGALTRILPPVSKIDLPGHLNIPLVSHWPMTLRDGIGLNALLRRHLETVSWDKGSPDGTEVVVREKPISVPLILSLARRKSWRNGVNLMWVDEFQFVSHGTNANSRATSLLLQLLGIGPHIIFVANYSLVHKLKQRNQEDRQRLVSDPLILEPDRCSSAEWRALINEYKAVAPDVFVFNLDEAAAVIHELTFGIKRLVVALLVCAYREARQKGRRTVGLDEIRCAYKSSSYTSNREDVETLQRQSIEGKMLRSDLWCPFDRHDPGVSAADDETANVAVAQRAIDSFEAKIEDQLLDSSLLPEEREAVQRLEAAKKHERAPGKVIRMRRTKATKESLLQACKLFDEQ